MPISYESWCFYFAWLLVITFLLPLILSVTVRVLKRKARSVEGNESCWTSWLLSQQWCYHPHYLFPILASCESMEKCLCVDGDFSHILLTYHIDPAGEGSSLAGLTFLLLPEHFLMMISIIITIVTRCWPPTLHQLSHFILWHPVRCERCRASYPDGWTEAQNLGTTWERAHCNCGVRVGPV